MRVLLLLAFSWLLVGGCAPEKATFHLLAPHDIVSTAPGDGSLAIIYWAPADGGGASWDYQTADGVEVSFQVQNVADGDYEAGKALTPQGALTTGGAILLYIDRTLSSSTAAMAPPSTVFTAASGVISISDGGLTAAFDTSLANGQRVVGSISRNHD